MPDDQPDARDLRERVADLEATVSDQQETIQKLMPSRRQALAGAGLLGGGLLGGRLSTGTARAQAAGQVGTDTDPVDVKAWTLSGDIVSRAEAIDNLEGNVYLEPDGTDPDTILEEDGDIVFLHEE